MGKRISVFILSFLTLFMVSMPVRAVTIDSTTVEISIKGGSLDIISPVAKIDFDSVIIDGNLQTIPVDLGTLVVTDFRGTGEGWHVTITANQFTDGIKSLPTGCLKYNGIDSITPVNTSFGLPEVVNDSFNLDTGTAQKILSAAPENGMGKFEIEFNQMELIVNTSELYSGKYKTTLTYNVVSGP